LSNEKLDKIIIIETQVDTRPEEQSRKTNINLLIFNGVWFFTVLDILTTCNLLHHHWFAPPHCLMVSESISLGKKLNSFYFFEKIETLAIERSRKSEEVIEQNH
jgi:hypothetical protein